MESFSVAVNSRTSRRRLLGVEAGCRAVASANAMSPLREPVAAGWPTRAQAHRGLCHFAWLGCLSRRGAAGVDDGLVIAVRHGQQVAVEVSQRGRGQFVFGRRTEERPVVDVDSLRADPACPLSTISEN